MAIRDRMRSLFSRTPKPIEGIGNTASVIGTQRVNEKAKKIAESTDALFGRMSYTAGPILTRYSTYPGTGLNPTTLDAIFKEADLGIMLRKADLDEQIYLRDCHLRCVDSAVRNAVVGKPFRVRPANETDLAVSLAKYVRSVVDQIDSFDGAMYGLLASHGFGYSCAEMVWDFSSVRVPGENKSTEVINGLFPRSLEWVHNKHFRFNYVTDETLLDVGQGGVIPLTPNKFVFHTSNDVWFTEKLGYMRAVAPIHMLKSHAMRDWAVFVALYGLPNILGKYPGDTYEQSEAKSIYETVLTNFGQGKPTLVPDDIKVEVTPAPMGGRAQDPHAAMIGWCETQQSKIIQGETLTTEIGGSGSYALGNVHADTKHDTAVMLAKGLAETVRRDIFRSILEMNMDDLTGRYGASPEDILASVPFASWRIEREMSPAERMTVFADAINKLGMQVGVDQVREEMAIDPPRSGAEILKGEPVAIASGGAAVGSIEASTGVDNPKPETPAPAPKKASKRVTKKPSKPSKG